MHFHARLARRRPATTCHAHQRNFSLLLRSSSGLAGSTKQLVRFPARIIIEFFRGTSLLVQLMWLFYVLPGPSSMQCLLEFCIDPELWSLRCRGSPSVYDPVPWSREAPPSRCLGVGHIRFVG